MPVLPTVLLAASISSIAFLAGCSSVSVSVDYDPNVDFSVLHSYAWLPSPSEQSADPRLANPLVHARVKKAVDVALAAKGCSVSSGGSPDFFVNYTLGLEGRVDLQTTHVSYGYGRSRHYGGYSGYGSIGHSETRAYPYEQGTLVIDILTAKAKDLIWRGTGSARVRKEGTPKEREERAQQAIKEILADFPPKK